MATRQRDEEAIFNDARKIESAVERAEYLRQCCGDDHRLKARLEALLGIHDQEPEFMAVPPSALAPTVQQPTVAEGPGTVIGSYKLLQQIGEGGFGVVYMAEQEHPVRRKVALKVIKPGMDTKEVIARFEVEEQALALMEHPNIAHVLDAGATESGRPYFVMELVKGIPITDYCDQYNLTPRERLDLFASVCHAVQHAHQKGIIHRDIKPNNVLVTLHDGEPVVKVIDFGVAKAINQRLTERTLFTKFAQLVGTPLYMSPEQAELSGLDVDTRTDIYSLGVLLYELLTGTTPFDKRRIGEAAYDEIRRIIREEEPPKPSTKISTLGNTASAVSAHRKTEPKRLSALLRGDLDWIVMKALEKDRTRRYETAKDFAADVMRYVNNEPVEASPPSPVYKMRKFVRRNKASVAMGVIAGVVFLSLGVGSWIVKAAHMERRAAEAEGEAITLKLRQKELENELKVRQLADEREKRQAEEDRRRRAEQRENDLKWLAEDALPSLEKLRSDEKWSEAFAIAELAREKFPDDRRVQQCWYDVSCTWTVVTDLPGAQVHRKPYGDDNAEWEHLGTTPLEATSSRGFFRWKIVKEGCETVEGCAGPEDIEIRSNLATNVRLDMVLVSVPSLHERDVEFLIDRHEVTNRQFKRFVQDGGYNKPEYWKQSFLKDGTKVSREDAIAQFVDATGKPGPSTWKDGTYPEGEDDHPVRGISWYEAAAFAESVGKALPTIYDFQLASGRKHAGWIVPESNFDGQGPVTVGKYDGVGPFGTYDMAGNVKEWCWNQGVSQRRFILGGAWNEPEYMFGGRDARPPFDRSETNGFRCVVYLTPPDEQLLADVITDYRDYSQETPVSDEVFQTIKAMYSYDKKPLNATIVRAEDTVNCRHEIVEFDGAYDDDRVIAHFFLPKGAAPPYQTVVFFPGGYADDQPAFPKNAYILWEFPCLLDSGRAVVWPIYKGTYERGAGTMPSGTRGYVNRTIQQAQDLFRTVDYLEERPDIDVGNLAYLGSSWGSRLGPIFLAMENRIKAAVLLHGGLPTGKWGLPREVDTFNFLTRVTIPTLMVNGRSDELFPFETSQRPFFQHLGTADSSKEHIVVDGFHSVAINHRETATLRWLDRYLGPAWSAEDLASLSEQEKLERMETRARQYVGMKRYDDAEQICRETLDSRRRVLGAKHRDTLKTICLLATIAEKQTRNEEALTLFEEALDAQHRELGDEDADSLQTAKSMAGFCNWWAFQLSTSTDASPTDYARAVTLARRAIEVDPLNGWRFVLALAYYRQSDWQACFDTMQESLEVDSQWWNQWFLLAMVHLQRGDEELARHWYTAACEWVTKSNTNHKPTLRFRSEAASVLGLPTQWPPANWTREQHVHTYSRLIESQPAVARLLYCRGSHYGRLGQWEKAVADYRKAADLDPNTPEYREAEAALVACVGTPEEKLVVCNRFYEECHDRTPHARAIMVLLCSLIPGSGVDGHELDRIIDDVLEDANVRPYHKTAKGMSLYRLGRFEEALAILPNPSLGFNNPKAAVLPVFFRAMARHQLGDAYTSRKLLEQARQASKEQIASPEGPILPYQDRPAVWCMIQIALREAEALIGPVDDSPEKVADAAAKA